MKLSNILVPIDFSKSSLNALEWGCTIAEKSNAKLHVFHCYEYSATYAQVNYLTFMETIADSVTKNLFKDMKALEKQYSALSRLETKYDISFDFPIKGISDYAKNNNIDLIVMGTQGRNDLTNRLMGSITSTLMDHTTTPVMAIPENHAVKEIKNIALADDFRNVSSEQTLKMVAFIASLYNAEVKILHISKREEQGATVDTDEVLRIAKVFKDVPHSYAFQTSPEYDNGILNYVEKENIDMLVLLPHKHGFFFNIFKKSTKDSIVHNTKIPMLAIKE